MAPNKLTVPSTPTMIRTFAHPVEHSCVKLLFSGRLRPLQLPIVVPKGKFLEVHVLPSQTYQFASAQSGKCVQIRLSSEEVQVKSLRIAMISSGVRTSGTFFTLHFDERLRVPDSPWLLSNA